MKKVFLGSIAIAAIAALSILATSTRATESYFYQGASGHTATFYLIGGQYSLYIYAKRPVKGPYAPESKSCFFNGNFQRIWPTHDVMRIGTVVPISTIVPYKMDVPSLNLPAGLYRLFVVPLADCAWKFIISSTNQNPAGIAPVVLYRKTSGLAEISTTVSLRDLIQFYAQFRTDHNANVAVLGTMQLLHDGQVVRTIPLKTGLDQDSLANAFYADMKWDVGDAKSLGKNEVKFTVKIGSTEFTSTGEFTLTQ